MRVRATQKGFFGGVLREPGTLTGEFVLDDPAAQFSGEWMVAVEADDPAPDPKPAPEPAPAEVTPAAPAKPAAAPKPEAEKL